MRWPTIALFVIVASFQICELRAAENWPQWRGPSGTGVAAAGEYPAKFSNTEGVAWSVELPGKGTSTPAVWGDRIFVSCAIGASPSIGSNPYKRDGKSPPPASTAHDGLLCYNTQGKELWRKELGLERSGKHPNGSGSNPSPVTDGKSVVVYFKSGTLACFDMDGKEKWKVNVQDQFGKDTLWWDLGTSPVLYDGRVIVAVIQEGESYLLALDLDSGKVAWRQPREYKCPVECDQTYSTPQLATVDGRDVLVTWGADHLTGHDPATGKLLWECGGFNPHNEGNWRTIASPSISDGIAIVPYGRGTLLAGVRLNSSGDITDTNRIWESAKHGLSCDVPTPVTTNGKAYVLSDRGLITCLDLATGNELWSSELPQSRNKFYASPILAGNKLFCVREDGMAFVGEVSDTGYKELAKNDMGERIFATPVPIRGGLLIRGDQHLFRIGNN